MRLKSSVLLVISKKLKTLYFYDCENKMQFKIKSKNYLKIYDVLMGKKQYNVNFKNLIDIGLVENE